MRGPRLTLGLLELLAALDHLDLWLGDFTAEDIFQTLGPYMQNHLGRDIRFHGGLSVEISFFLAQSHRYENLSGGDLRLASQERRVLSPANFSVDLRGPVSVGSATRRLILDLLTFVPHKHVVSLKLECSVELPEDLLVAMPNIQTLWLSYPTMSYGFLLPDPDGPHANTKLLPSLRYLQLEDVAASDAGWEPLTIYLAHQTSEGQVISLEVFGDSCIPPEVVEEIHGLVETFSYDPISDADDGEGGIMMGTVRGANKGVAKTRAPSGDPFFPGTLRDVLGIFGNFGSRSIVRCTKGGYDG